MQRSLIGRYSIGIVAMNKPLTSRIIDVIPVESLTLMDGELTDAVYDKASSGLNGDGSEYSATVKVGATLKAEWLGETNRLTPPDVRRGEQVWIWQAENADRYFWTSLGRDDKQRRLETVIYRYSGLPTVSDDEISKDNSYYCEISTHNKSVTFETSQRNGEACRYLVQFDTGSGSLTINDTIGNVIQIKSPQSEIVIKNSSNSQISLTKQIIQIVSDTLIEMQSKTIKLTASNILLSADLIAMKAPTIGLSGGAISATSSGGMTMNAGSVKISSPSTRITGTLQCDKILTGELQSLAVIHTPGISGQGLLPASPVPPVE